METPVYYITQLVAKASNLELGGEGRAFNFHLYVNCEQSPNIFLLRYGRM